MIFTSTTNSFTTEFISPFMSITNLMRFNNLRGDLFDGVTAAIVSLPLAFWVASEIGRIGRRGAIFVIFFAAWFDGTPTMIFEPTVNKCLC
jgi:sulfate permease, SulP family